MGATCRAVRFTGLPVIFLPSPVCRNNHQSPTTGATVTDGPRLTNSPPSALFPVHPTGGVSSPLLAGLRDTSRQVPPKYPYPRFGIIPWSFYNADWRYLDDPNNTETDFFDPLKRIRLGDNWMFTTGGDFRTRYMNEVDSRLSGIDNTYDQYRLRVYGDLWYRDLFRGYAEFLYAE